MMDPREERILWDQRYTKAGIERSGRYLHGEILEEPNGRLTVSVDRLRRTVRFLFEAIDLIEASAEWKEWERKERIMRTLIPIHISPKELAEAMDGKRRMP